MHEPKVTVDTTIAAPPQRVWQAMQAGAMFPGTEIETDWKVGHPIVFKGEWDGRRFTDRGEIRSVSEARELSFSHWSDNDGTGKRPPSYHVVRYTLEPAGEHTRVILSQFDEGNRIEIDDGTKAEFEKNWMMMLQGLKETAEKH